MALVLTADANPGTATWVDESTLAGGLSSVQTRIQLVDLGAGTTTGVVSFGVSIPAERVVLGAFLRLNGNPTSGGTVASIDVSVAQGGANLITSLDVFGATGAPKYLTPFTDAADFTVPPLVSATAGQPAYQISVTGPGADLNQITAFDITVGVIVSGLLLTVP